MRCRRQYHQLDQDGIEENTDCQRTAIPRLKGRPSLISVGNVGGSGPANELEPLFATISGLPPIHMAVDSEMKGT